MRVDRRALAAALKVLTKIAVKIAAKNVQPILNTVLFEADGGLLDLTAADTHQRLTISMPAEGELHTCLPANLLARLIKPGKRGD
jgi:DNA polymerase III sliding clamp (beta) subunit (PCNA family)